MWTDAARTQHAPRTERYPSDLTDAEWAIIEPLLPPARSGGRPRATNMREVMNGVRYVLRTGCQWRQLPKDFPPRSTVYNCFWEWTRYGVLDRIHHELLVRCLEAEGRDASPTAAIIDTQVAKATEKGGAARIRSVIFVKLHAEHSAMTPARKPLANIYCERQALTMRHQAHA
jgi:transposase